MRALLAYLSFAACGINIAAYLASFFGESLARPIGFVTAPLFVLWFVVAIPIYVRESAHLKNPTFLWYGIPGTMPKWTVIVLRLLVLAVLTHIIWMVVRCAHGVPAIEDGQFVLESNGRAFQVITRDEYVSLLGVILRAWTSLLVFMYFIPATYWWPLRHDA